MDPIILQELSHEKPSAFHDEILKTCKDLVRASRLEMSKYYKGWDHADKLFRANKCNDWDDTEQGQKKEPTKLVVPLTYAQVMSFVSFMFTTFNQKENFFELQGHNLQGQLASDVAESLLSRDLKYNKWSVKLFQMLLDVARFNLTVVKHTWVDEKQKVKKMVDVPGRTILGMQVTPPTQVEQEVIESKFQGNKLFVISPYRFFPDVRLPLTRFQEGEFCASEDEYSFPSIKQFEKDGLVAGVNFIPTLSKELLAERGESRLSSFKAADIGVGATFASGYNSTVIITEVQINLIPNKYMIAGKPMGTEDFPVKYVVWYANDSRVIKCEPLTYPHGEFTYDLAQYTPDQQNLINAGLVDMVEHLQDLIDWFINARVASVRKTISNQFIADPSAIELKDFTERKTVVRLKPGVVRSGVDKWIKQIDVQDVTQGHINDSNSLYATMQTVTGINENLTGQFHTGRRSATEARNSASGAAGRLLLIARLMYDSCFEPLGQKMISNLQNGLDVKTYVKLIGMPQLPEDVEAFQGFIQVDKANLVGSFDFEVFDGTLSSEKIGLAQTLEEMLKAMMTNPQFIQVVGFDPKKVFLEMVRLRGLKNTQRFLPDNPQEMQQRLAQVYATINGQPGNGSQPPASGPIAGPGGVSAPTGQPLVPPAVPQTTGGIGSLIQ